MPEVSDTRSTLRQNLLDAGCGPKTVQKCMDLAGEEKTTELMRILSRHRHKLLDSVHRGQKRIDCLDYLIYQLEKGRHENDTRRRLT